MNRGLLYNGGVPDSSENHGITRAETIGIVLLALAILAVVLVRWGGVIDWSAR